MAELKSKDGVVGMFETVAKWTEGEGATKITKSKTGTFSGPAILPPSDREKDDGAHAVLTAYFADNVKNDEQAGAFFDSWLYGRDLKAKAKLRPATATETPIISREGIKINLATGERTDKDGKAMPTLPLEKCIAFINRAMDESNDLGIDPAGQVTYARGMLLASGNVVEKNGKLTPKGK